MITTRWPAIASVKVGAAARRSASRSAPSGGVAVIPSGSRPAVTTVIRRPRSPRTNHPTSRINPRPLRSSNPRLPTIHRSPQVTIPKRHVFVLTLRRREVNVTVMFSSQLVPIGPSMGAVVTAVEADTIDRDVVDHRPVVDVGHM
jgi:hypothetical protein